ncbi:MAG TPA: M28 family peptidase [Chitinophagaceae bacterium]|nr:M28 family peptidase [Chitinophagaceae bacterium]
MKKYKALFFSSAFLFLSYSLKSQKTLADSLIHPDTLRQIVEVLAADSLNGRFAGTLENLQAALFIAGQFEIAGIHPIAGNRKYFMEIEPGWLNVVGAIIGKSKPGELVIFSAHYDHIGTIKTNPFPGMGGNAKAEKGDEIYNGANDNASGVSAVISLAKYFKAMNNNERTLIFVAFTGEELGLIGSKYFADSFDADSVIAVINIEMIGRSDSPKIKPYVTGFEKSDLIEILNKNYRQLMDKSEKNYFKPDLYKNSFLFLRSDNYPFAQKGIPAHSIMLTSPFDKYYHNLNDEPGTLDYQVMQKVIHSVAASVNGLVTGTDTPKRIVRVD